MNFDIKDVKSWANRHDVKVGDEGYLSDHISYLRDAKDAKTSKLDLELSSKDGKKISLPNVISGFVQKLKAAENE